MQSTYNGIPGGVDRGSQLPVQSNGTVAAQPSKLKPQDLNGQGRERERPRARVLHLRRICSPTTSRYEIAFVSGFVLSRSTRSRPSRRWYQPLFSSSTSSFLPERTSLSRSSENNERKIFAAGTHPSTVFPCARKDFGRDSDRW